MCTSRQMRSMKTDEEEYLEFGSVKRKRRIRKVKTFEEEELVEVS